MQQNSRSLTKSKDWQQVRSIMDRGEAGRAKLEERYLDEYDTRVEIVRRRLINQGGELNHNHPAPAGIDKFNGDAINRQANREVRQDHERALQQSRDGQDVEIQSLKHHAGERNRMESKGKAKDQFAQVSDRRDGPDRRAPKRSR